MSFCTQAVGPTTWCDSQASTRVDGEQGFASGIHLPRLNRVAGPAVFLVDQLERTSPATICVDGSAPLRSAGRKGDHHGKLPPRSVKARLAPPPRW